jgi:endoglucanase
MPKLLFVILLFCTISTYAQKDSTFIGINICGPEFGEKNFPGNLNTDYIYPDFPEIDYFSKKGFSVISLPVKWERIQRSLFGNLDSNETNELKKFINRCNAFNEKVIITLQNFGRYKQNKKELILGKELPVTALPDVWKKIAQTLSGYPNVYGYDIMNEPFDIKEKVWFETAQQTIDSIRKYDTSVNIIVDGLSYSYCFDWIYNNDKLKNLKDLSDKIIYDAHCYFDEDHSGRYQKKFNKYPDPNIGVQRVKPFISWLEKNHKKGIIGEFGIPANEEKWFVVMDNFLNYIHQHNLSAKYWAAGKWWNQYDLSIEPANGIDKPQMAILKKYINRFSSSTNNP